MLWPRFLLALALDLASGAPTVLTGDALVVSRHYHGDLFTFEHRTDGCGASFCYDWGGQSALALQESPCRCRCEPPFPTYREDIGACVNDVQECHLADFSMGETQEKVPFVFTPERGQLVHPSAEITMSGLAPDNEPVVSPVCVVSGSEVMTRAGWLAINSTFEPPFRLRRDQGKTFLQWVGEDIGAEVIEGRLVLVRLLCKDAGNAMRARFSPCVAFRVAGTQGQAVAATQESESAGGSLAVGLSVAAVLVLYIAAMAGYLVYRRRKRRAGHQLIEDALMGKGRRAETAGGGRERQSRRKKEDKDAKDGPSDLTQRPVSSLSHGSAGSSDVNERLPEDTLSALVDAEREADMLDDDDDMSGANAQLRRRLYFNPAFFDPDQLHDPPPGALEFLAKIREMITIAKLKMQAKQYQPSLPAITEAAEEAEAAAEAEAEAEGACPSPDHGSVDIDRWLETVVRESNSDDGGQLYSDSLPRPRRQKAAAPPPPVASPTAAAAAAAAGARGVTTSWRQQARQQREDADSDTLVGASGDERRNNASFESDDTLNDLVSEAESKVPKLHSDEDSVYSEVRTMARRRRAPGADGLYEEINVSDRSLSAFSGEYTSVSINGEGTVIRTGGKMTIEVDDPAVASDAESEEEVFDPDTLEKRRIRVRKARRVRRKQSFYDDSLERRKRGINYEEKFETTHINFNTVLNTSVESTESVYKRWGSVASGSEANSVYSRINFVTSKQQKQEQEQKQEQKEEEKSRLVVGNLRQSQRNLKTFKDYSTVKFGGRTSLLEQWKKKNDPLRSDSAASDSAVTLPVTSPVPSLTSPTPGVQSPVPSLVSALRRHDSSGGTRSNDVAPTPPIPPKATAPPPAPPVPVAAPVPVKAGAAAAAAGAPPLPPRTSPQRERSILRTAAPPLPSQPPPSTPPPPRPARGQPPLPPKSTVPPPPKSTVPPPPLPSKTRAPAPPPPTSPSPPPSTRRYFLGQIDGTADDGPRRRRNSAGESETNSSSSSHDEAASTGSAGTDKSEPGSHTLGRQVEARLERHLHRSYSASDVSRSEIESLASSRSSLRSPQRCLPNVLERITECESAIRRGAGAGTGMAIAMSLKERQTAAAAAAQVERERPSSIRDKWRRLVEPAPTTAAAAAVIRDDSGYQSTDSAESHRPQLATPGGIRRLVKKFDRSDDAEETAASRTRWVHVVQ